MTMLIRKVLFMIMMKSILYDVDDGDACVDNDADDDRR